MPGSRFNASISNPESSASVTIPVQSEIPVPVNVVNRRVTCTTCPITEDFSPYRLNIFFNAQTDIVEQVRCG